MNIGPQVDIPVGAPENPGSNIGAWNGLTIKEILEKVDLSNIIMEEDNKKQLVNKDPMISRINPESAFLGPKLWSRSIPMPMTGGQENEDFSVMNIDGKYILYRGRGSSLKLGGQALNKLRKEVARLSK